LWEASRLKARALVLRESRPAKRGCPDRERLVAPAPEPALSQQTGINRDGG
jgi:hypothetical protein